MFISYTGAFLPLPLTVVTLCLPTFGKSSRTAFDGTRLAGAVKENQHMNTTHTYTKALNTCTQGCLNFSCYPYKFAVLLIFLQNRPLDPRKTLLIPLITHCSIKVPHLNALQCHTWLFKAQGFFFWWVLTGTQYRHLFQHRPSSQLIIISHKGMTSCATVVSTGYCFSPEKDPKAVVTVAQ